MLTKILTRAEQRATAAHERIESFRSAAAEAPPVRSLTSALSGEGLAVVAEIKRRSPSVGVIDPDLDPVAQAIAYVEGGADAISVLTEPYFFDGSMADLEAVRRAVDIPVLRKDFTLVPAQIWEARASGADAVLLIVAALDRGALVVLLAEAEAAGVDAIVEAHTGDEAEVAVAAGARIIGVNNRDLATFRTDLSVAESVAGVLPDDVVTIAESGISDIDGARRMAHAGYDAILVGEALVRADKPGEFLARLKEHR